MSNTAYALVFPPVEKPRDLALAPLVQAMDDLCATFDREATRLVRDEHGALVCSAESRWALDPISAMRTTRAWPAVALEYVTRWGYAKLLGFWDRRRAVSGVAMALGPAMFAATCERPDVAALFTSFACHVARALDVPRFALAGTTRTDVRAVCPLELASHDWFFGRLVAPPAPYRDPQIYLAGTVEPEMARAAHPKWHASRIGPFAVYRAPQFGIPQHERELLAAE